MEQKEKIKITTIDDINNVVALYPEADEERLKKIQSNVEKDIAQSEKGDRIIYGVEIGEKIVGTAQLVFKGEKEFYADGKARAHVHHVRILESLRGKGVGTKLMEEVENEAKRRGFTEITLGVDEDNQGAIDFYGQLGYKEFIQEKGEQGEPIIGMKKEL